MLISNRIFDYSDGEIGVLVVLALGVFAAAITGLVFNINYFLDNLYRKDHGRERRSW